MIQLFVDNRERSFLTYLGDIAEINVCSLPVADYVLITDRGAVLVERKTLSDFVTSFRNGRLWEQLVKLIRCEHFRGSAVLRRLLVIEGFPTAEGMDMESNNRFLSSLLGAQMECVFTYHIPLLFVSGNEGMGRLLRVLAKREEEDKNDRPPEPRWYRPRFPSELPIKDQKTYFVCSIPGVGNSLACNLLERFNTVDDLCHATERDLEKVKGIGKKRAKTIHQFLH